MEANKEQWVDDRLAALQPKGDWQPDVSRGLTQFREQRERVTRRTRHWGWLATGAVAAALPLMAFPTTRVFAQRCVSACVGQTSWVRTMFASNISNSASNSAPGAAYAKPENRKMAPDFVLDDASGQPVKLSDLRGKVVLLNFWATWCVPCSLEIPWFIELQNTHRDAAFATLGVSLDEDGWDAVKPYIEKRKINYRVMVGNDDLAQLYGAASLPTTFIIDKSGRIAVTHVGLCGKSEYEADVNAVLAEK